MQKPRLSAGFFSGDIDRGSAGSQASPHSDLHAGRAFRPADGIIDITHQALQRQLIRFCLPHQVCTLLIPCNRILRLLDLLRIVADVRPLPVAIDMMIQV